MKRFISACLALASAGAIVAVSVPTVGAARPQYGGTLRAAIAGTIRSANPAASIADPIDAAARDRVLPLVFETLTRVDDEAGLQPLLATSWTSEARGSRWTIRLRAGVPLHDGSVLESWQVATSLRAVESRWRIANDGDALIIETPEPVPDLPWRLADVDHAIAVRSPSSERWLGTGPFRLDRLDATALTLRAHDGYHRGRPFLDAVELQMNRPLPAQLSDFEAGRVDFAGVLPTDARRLTQRGTTTIATRPIELAALVFEPHRAADAQQTLRRTVSTAINRSTIGSVLLQQRATTADALLPAWLSGYRWTPAPLGRGAALALPQDQRQLIVRADPGDVLTQSIADRVAVDARESGFSVTIQEASGLAPRPDARVIRLRMAATTPERALADLLAKLGQRSRAVALGDSPTITTIDDVYRVETQILGRAVVIPIVHLSDVYAVGPRVSSWQSKPVLATGAWNLADVWVRAVQP